MNENTVFYLIGLGNGEYVRNILNTSKNRVYIYVPDTENYEENYIKYELEDIIKDSRVTVSIKGKSEITPVDLAMMGVDIYNYNSIMMGAIPGYENYLEEYRELKAALGYRIELIMFERKTDIDLGRISAYNELSNMKNIIKQHSLKQIQDLFSDLDFTDIPAIIVSAGPSLDKNICELRNAHGHAFIIAVDTALKALIRAGILPDIAVCVDPRKELVFFNDSRIYDIPMVMAFDVPASLIKLHPENNFYTGNGIRDLFNSYSHQIKNEEYPLLEAGGSVANSAFFLAVMLGFKRIILVGQDLAFTDGKGHTKDAYDDDRKNHEDTLNRDDICEVEDIYGQMIKTETRMRSYILWFEAMIKKYRDIDVIDATEGGAKIHGSKLMKLKDAVKSYCIKDLDFSTIIKSIGSYYTIEEQMAILNDIESDNMGLNSAEIEIKKGIEAYQMLRLVVEGKLKKDTSEIMNTITEVNSIQYVYPIMSVVIKYSMQQEYDTRESVANDNNSDDIKAVIDSAVSLLYNYEKAINEIKSDLKSL